ncbi:MAG: hypothetical protein HZB87_12800, partial [Desulfatitalea sp.]|nr:hypothetical protein [Desulfatitalea sp.]
MLAKDCGRLKELLWSSVTMAHDSIQDKPKLLRSPIDEPFRKGDYMHSLGKHSIVLLLVAALLLPTCAAMAQPSEEIKD